MLAALVMFMAGLSVHKQAWTFSMGLYCEMGIVQITRGCPVQGPPRCDMTSAGGSQ